MHNAVENMGKCGTLVHIHVICMEHFKPMLEGHTKKDRETEVPRVGHRYQTRGGSIGGRTLGSIAVSQKSARTHTNGCAGVTNA
jgi:hypothetical protein